MQQWQLRVTKARNGCFGLSLTEEGNGAIYVEKVIVGGAADRCGLQPQDKIIAFNRRTPRNLDEAIGIVKDSSKFLDLVIAREDPDVAPVPPITEQVHPSKNLLGYPCPDFPEGPEWGRKEEKESLQHLNNRLAGCIDRVRRLQIDNRSLGEQMKYMKQSQYTEIQKIIDHYDKEIAALKQVPETFDDQKESSDGLYEENQELKLQLFNMNNALLKKSDDLTQSKGVISQLHENVKKLSNRLTKAENEKQSQTAVKDAEIQQLQGDLSKQLGMYQTLLDAKVALDMEIAVYKELLESVENRLGIVIYENDPGERTRVRGPSGSSYESSSGGSHSSSSPTKPELVRRRTEQHIGHL